MHGSGGRKEVAVMQCMVQVVVRKTQPFTMHDSGGSREEAVIQSCPGSGPVIYGPNSHNSQ